MMQKIILLTDYQNRFGSKYLDNPYRSGFDKALLKKYFNHHGYQPVFQSFASIDFYLENYADEPVLYTSSEDQDYHYKSFIEDVVLGLELHGAKVIPHFKYLRANNNKVFMEILRDQITSGPALKAKYYGTFEELKDDTATIQCPVVIKKTAGASGTGVFLAQSPKELLKIAKRIARTRDSYDELWDYGRSLKHPGYRRESRFRRKFIIQDYIPGLNNDWKIYAFGERYYIFNRPIKKGRDIRASGGGYENYRYGVKAQPPEGIFEFAESVHNKLDVPHSSLDIAYDGKQFYLLEFQCVYFGTAGIVLSEEYFKQRNGSWVSIPEQLDQERVYVESIVDYLNKQNSV